MQKTCVCMLVGVHLFLWGSTRFAQIRSRRKQTNKILHDSYALVYDVWEPFANIVQNKFLIPVCQVVPTSSWYCSCAHPAPMIWYFRKFHIMVSFVFSVIPVHITHRCKTICLLTFNICGKLSRTSPMSSWHLIHYTINIACSQNIFYVLPS